MKCYVKDYPRPQLVRKEWTCLNGPWEFVFDDTKTGLQKRYFTSFPENAINIQVPFTYETQRSGIGDERVHECVWYHRTFNIDSRVLSGKKLLLHFEGSDFETRVWINGSFVGSHRGGYARFTFDISGSIRVGDNDITVMVEDPLDVSQPRGKQRWLKKNYACWYVQTTGIWKTVWLEYVPAVHISQVKLTPKWQDNTLCAVIDLNMPPEQIPDNLQLDVQICFDHTLVNRTITSILSKHTELVMDVSTCGKDDMNFVWDVKTWSPQEPNLYDISFRLLQGDSLIDEAESYFGMREVRIDGNNILLNGRPVYQKLILDQGYWNDSHLTPPDEEALIRDIDAVLAMGFNGVRKHQKIEDERFLYWCDVKGLLVWSEAPAAYSFNDYAVAEFTREWMEIVAQNYNHPSIITWTPFNESWGISRIETNALQQNFTEAIYHLTKTLDPFRPVIVNDGWEHTVSDIISLHDYEEDGDTLYERYTQCKEEILSSKVYHNDYKSAFANGYHYQGQPVIISEFGGIALDEDDEGWGYGAKAEGETAFLKRFDAITTAVKKLPYVCGYCYTQLTDVQQEVNGLLDKDRNYKVSVDKIREVNDRHVGYWREKQN